MHVTPSQGAILLQEALQESEAPRKVSTAFLKAFSALSIARGAATAKQRRDAANSLQQQHSLPAPLSNASKALQLNRGASLRGGQAALTCQTAAHPTLKAAAESVRGRSSGSLSRCTSVPSSPMSAQLKGTALARRAMAAAHRVRSNKGQRPVRGSTAGPTSAAVVADGGAGASHSTAADEAVASIMGMELGSSALKAADSGTLDRHLQLRPPTVPEQRWQTVADAAGFDLASGMYQEVIQQPLVALPDKLADSRVAVHSQQDLQLKELLSFAQDDLTTSAESSVAASPRPVSHAVDSIPKLRARTAVSSPGVSAKATPRTNVTASTQGLLDPARYNYQHMDGSAAEARLARLTGHKSSQSQQTGAITRVEHEVCRPLR